MSGSDRARVTLMLCGLFLVGPIALCGGFAAIGIVSESAMNGDEEDISEEDHAGHAHAAEEGNHASGTEARTLSEEETVAAFAKAAGEFRKELSHIERIGDYLSNVSHTEGTATVSIVVKTKWLNEKQPERLELAQSLMQVWEGMLIAAGVPVSATTGVGMSIVDSFGNEVGGYSAANGVWVAD